MKKTSTEMEIKISNARITNVTTEILPNGNCKLKFEVEMQKKHNNVGCILVEASKLSLTDDFMNYQPKTLREEMLKESISKAITIGTKDFHRPIMDPSYANKACDIIHYKAGESPATEKSYNFWKETLKDPDSRWCFGTKSQYVSFLGVLIKMLVAKEWTVEEAWDAICNDSKKLGNYWDSENSKHRMELTGSVEICGFFDLANTYKMLATDEESNCYWIAGGTYDYSGSTNPLADLELSHDCDEELPSIVPWFVCRPNEE
jgi:hypothetical protein